VSADAAAAASPAAPLPLGVRLRSYVPDLRMASRVWRRDFRVFSKLWRSSLLPQFFDPVLYLLAMGFGLGAYVARIQGIPYEQFIGAGLLASSVMWAASFETTWNIYFKMEETRLYDAILTTPVEVQDVVAGEVLWAATRSIVYGTAFLIVVAAFGLVESPWAVTAPAFLALGGACFATMGMTFTTVVARVDLYSYYYTLLITPMFLFAGIFYPLDRLPEWTHVVAWFTPLYHLVEITRDLVLGPELLPVLGNALWLVVLTALLFVVPVRAMRRRLVA
jgi:lipooligosaccharide transport system permease protein